MGSRVSNSGVIVSSVGFQGSFFVFRIDLEQSVRKLVEDRGEVRANVQNQRRDPRDAPEDVPGSRGLGLGFGFRIRVQGLGFKLQGSGFKVQGLGLG